MESRPAIERYGAVAVIARRGKLLVIQRSPSVAAPGAFCFPGGGIEPGEDEPTALRRELLEELAVEAVPRERLWTSVTTWGVHLAWWRAEIDPQVAPAPNPAEVDAFHWLTPRELEDLNGVLTSNLEFLRAWREGAFRLELE